jgi:hypothetical protein
MKLYYYVHTGHRFGLDRFRKAVSIINSLPELDITLLTSDYRIASSAKEFGVKKAVGIDVFRNIPNVSEYGDALIYDSTEHSEEQLVGMIHFFSKFIRISNSPDDYARDGEYLISPYLEDTEKVLNAIPVEEQFFGEFEKKFETTLFYGDDDYDKDLLRYLETLDDKSWNIILGFYFFINYGDDLKDRFAELFEVEEYDEVIKASKNIVTSSTQTAINSLASGGKPIFIERSDRAGESKKLLESLGVPYLESFDWGKISQLMKNENLYKELPNHKEKIRNFILNIK